MYINVYRAFVGAFVPNWIMCRKEISQGAKLCYGRLCQFSGKDGLCNPSAETIANELGVTERQAYTYIQELKEKKLISTVKNDTGINYYFLKHLWMGASLKGHDEQLKKTAPHTEENFSETLKKTSVEKNQLKESVKTTSSNDIQKLIIVYKQIIGIPIDDKDWDKAQFTHCVRPAKGILSAYDNDIKRAATFLLLFGKDMKEKNLSWTIHTANRKAVEYKYMMEKGKK